MHFEAFPKSLFFYFWRPNPEKLILCRIVGLGKGRFLKYAALMIQVWNFYHSFLISFKFNIEMEAFLNVMFNE